MNWKVKVLSSLNVIRAFRVLVCRCLKKESVTRPYPQFTIPDLICFDLKYIRANPKILENFGSGRVGLSLFKLGFFDTFNNNVLEMEIVRLKKKKN